VPLRNRLRISEQKSGFTLIELSIVLVIIGLIAGGILFGRDLIQSAERRAIIRDIESLKTSVTTFKLKYGGIPGDLINATEIWGTKSGTDCDNQIASPDERTCNGNGDGQVTFTPPGTGNSEGWCIWQHLDNAQLVNGPYTCSFRSSPIVAGAPPSNDNFLSRYYIQYVAVTAFPTYYLPTGNMLEIRGQGTNFPSLVPATAQYIDSKMDDGLPFNGVVQTVNYLNFPPIHHSRFSGCTTNTDPETAQYRISNPVVSCTMGTRLGIQ
jgi:prepilin-type N-terminal cleavage/methylation domain-containing protein